MRLRTPDELCAALGGCWLQEARSQDPVTGVGIDSRSQLDGQAFLAIRGERHDGHAFLDHAVASGATLLVVEKAAHVKLPAGVGVIGVQDGRQALGRLAHEERCTWSDTTVIAITGTAGKTTTKKLTHAALRTGLDGSAAPRSFNNDIGVPLTLLAVAPQDRYVVVEVGTNAPGEIDALGRMVEPDIAVITLVGLGHLEGLGSAEGVLAEKISLLGHVRSGGHAIVHADSVPSGLVPSNIDVTTFGTVQGAGLRLSGYGQEGERSWMQVEGGPRLALGLPGRHNALNALAALAVARRMGIQDAEACRGFVEVEPDEMRLRPVRLDGITVYNDAYNANPESMAASIETFLELTCQENHRVIVLGDMLELGEHGPDLHRQVGRLLVEADRQQRIDHVVFVGPLMAQAADVLKTAWDESRITRVERLTDTTAMMIRNCFEADGAVLLKGSRGLRLERILASKADVLQPAAGE